MARFSSVVERAAHVYSSSHAEAACKPLFLDEDTLAMQLMSGDRFMDLAGSKEELTKKEHGAASLDWGVLELLSQGNSASKETLKRFESGSTERSVQIFSAARAKATCESFGKPVSLEEDDMLVFRLLSDEPSVHFIGTQEELVKKDHGEAAFDWGIFELLSLEKSSDETMTRFSSVVERAAHVYSSSHAEAACKPLFLNEDTLAMQLMSGDRFMDLAGSKEELTKQEHGAASLDWGVFELLSNAASKETVERFRDTTTEHPVQIFSAARAKATCESF